MRVDPTALPLIGPLLRAWREDGEQRSVGRQVPQYALLPGGKIVRHLDGAVSALFEAVGRPYECDGEDDWVGQHETLCILQRDLNRIARLTSTRHLVRGLADASALPRPLSGGGLPARLDAGVRRRLLGEGRLYRNRLYLGGMVRPPGVKAGAGGGPDPAAPHEDDIALLEQAIGLMRSALGRYGLRPLGVVRRGAGPLYSEAAEALERVLTGRGSPGGVPVSLGAMGGWIMPHRPVFRRDGVIEVRRAGRVDYGRMFAFSTYPDASDAAMFGAILSGPYRCVLSQHMTAMAMHEATAAVGAIGNRMVSADDPAYGQRKALAAASSELMDRQYGLGVHNATLAVWADGERALDRAAERASEDMRRSGAVVSPVDWEVEAEFYGQLPGAEANHTRSVPWKTRNFAAAASLRSFARGWRGDLWCDDCADVFLNNAGEAFAWNPHTSAAGGPGGVGHALFLGANDSGKTVLMLRLVLALHARAGAQVVWWDKDRGAKIALLLAGGIYISIKVGLPSGLNLLQGLSLCDEDAAFAVSVIRGLIMHDGAGDLTADESERLSLAVRMVLDLPRAARSLGEVAAFLGVGEGSAGSRLARWSRAHGGDLAWVLDCAEDRLHLDASVIGIDQTSYLGHPDAGGPIQAVLAHRVGKLIDGRKLVNAWDEVQASLRIPFFGDLIANAAATWRKLGALLWLATQSARTLLDHPVIAAILRDNVFQHFHFHNPAADAGEYARLGIEGRPFEWVKSDLSAMGKGAFLLRQGSDFTPLSANMDGMDDELAELSGKEWTVNLFERVLEDFGGVASDDMARVFHARRRAVLAGVVGVVS